MLANDYQKAAMRTQNPEVRGEKLLLNGVLGLAGETGEFADMVKKHLFQGHPLDQEKLVLELGDICYYVAIAATALGVDLGIVMRLNNKKLADRYPNGFEASKSINRKENSNE